VSIFASSSIKYPTTVCESTSLSSILTGQEIESTRFRNATTGSTPTSPLSTMPVNAASFSS
jgi:hypothetical protein